MKRILKIKTADFIDWFFNGESDQENYDTVATLGREIAEKLKEGAVTTTPEEIFNQCVHEVVPIRLVELEGSIWINKPEYGELGDLNFEYELELTKN